MHERRLGKHGVQLDHALSLPDCQVDPEAVISLYTPTAKAPPAVIQKFMDESYRNL